MSHLPSYSFLSLSDWDKRISQADGLASSCGLCPRRCGVNRFKNEKGFCRAPGELVISSIFPHHGEEPPISGNAGSGTVFFSLCTMRCVFCQNYQISHEGEGEPYSPADLAERMLKLQKLGCHNINLVTPTHFLPWILRALREAVEGGLRLPIVYNCGGYERTETLDLLDGIVDIHLPDMKYGDNEPARTLSSAPDYVEVNQAAIRCMFKQVGPLRMTRDGVAVRGMCIRHLVLPNGRAHSEKIAAFLAARFDPGDITVSVMAQYRPMHRAHEYPGLARSLTVEEYEQARKAFVEKGFGGFYQELQRLDTSFCIDFEKRKSEPLIGDM